MSIKNNLFHAYITFVIKIIYNSTNFNSITFFKEFFKVETL